MTYSNNHRALLQAIMDRGAVSSADMRELCLELFQRHEAPHTYVHQINNKLELLNMAITHVACEITGEKYWILVSTILDETTAKFQTEYSTAQLELLRKILSELVTSTGGSIPSTMCLNLCSTLESKMSKADAEHFLTVMVEKRWFVKQDGKFYIGVRSIAELIPYFRATYPEDALNTCSLCRQVVFHGERCIYCQQVLHLACFANSARVQNPPKCPSCNNIMTTENIEDFERYNDDYAMDYPVGLNSEPVDKNNASTSSQKERYDRSIGSPGTSLVLDHAESRGKRSKRNAHNYLMSLPGTSSQSDTVNNKNTRTSGQKKTPNHTMDFSEDSQESTEEESPKKRDLRKRSRSGR